MIRNASTKKVYSHTGRPGLDPIVFFKMLLVGYLENCPTDRGLERLFQMRIKKKNSPRNLCGSI